MARLAEERRKHMLEKNCRRVSLMRDNVIDYPQLYLDVYIEGEEFEHYAFAPMLARAGCRKALTPSAADLVIFTGGSDVNPLLYGQVAHSSVHFSAKRDEQDTELFNQCIREGIPMFGVCRGMQFLHVMMGGTLYQDVNNHNEPHSLVDTVTGLVIAQVSSVHHQMVVNDGDPKMQVLAYSQTASRKALSQKAVINGVAKDVEALFYRDSCILGVQGHPEYQGFSTYTKWCLDLIQEYVCKNTDLVREEGVLRLPQLYRTERLKSLAELINGNIPVTEIN